jgi:valyl-tRNA synthetase
MLLGMKELSKAYNPADHEAKIYAAWEKSGAFKPNMDAPKDPFTIIMPPPNANGDLHAGHAMYVVEDIMTRYRRMQGHKTLWLPGTDHAGIETQVVYERELAKVGKSRFDFTPSEFYDDVMAYTKSNQHNIIDQLRSLGFSADWSRLKFTLDEDIIEVVYDTFKQLHDDGLVYRANRIVNWCPRCNAAFADIEISHREQLDPLYYITYGPFVIATVRPETKFGDTAIAVNPSDDRYGDLIGTTIEAEGLMGKFSLKVIGDDHVNPNFGTGVVKVTPAHDLNDWEMGLRHKLEVKQVIGTDGCLTELAGKYAGMPVAEARSQVVDDLVERGLMDHVDMSYSHSVAYHGRCGTLIEPLVTEQWWLAVDKLKAPAIEAVKSGQIKIVPARFEKVYIDWLENLRDWNISRQIWWGIQIPVYYRLGDDEAKTPYLVTTSEAEAREYYGEGNYEIETDTFDTWFSSSQWPFATLMATGDFDKGFYPTSVMETGRDILFQWVSRMVMLGLYRTGGVPFHTVYLHGLVNDEHGKKMSKSRGNVLNPLDITAKFGTDALRLALTIGITPGNDGALSEAKIEGYRNYCNKLWNVARFILGQLPDDYLPAEPTLDSPADHWMMEKLLEVTSSTTKAIEDYRFSEAGEQLYGLVWNDFADWYLEASKVSSNHHLLVFGLETILKLVHPIAPFVTEAIWGHLAWQSEQLIVSDWPNASRTFDETSAQRFGRAIEAVNSIRSLAADEKMVRPVVVTTDQVVFEQSALIQRLARTAEIKLQQEGTGLFISPGLWIEADPELISARRHRLDAQRIEKQSYLKGLESKLANTRYIESAPEAVVLETRNRRDDTLMLISKLDEQLAALNS